MQVTYPPTLRYCSTTESYFHMHFFAGRPQRGSSFFNHLTTSVFALFSPRRCSCHHPLPFRTLHNDSSCPPSERTTTGYAPALARSTLPPRFAPVGRPSPALLTKHFRPLPPRWQRRTGRRHRGIMKT